MSQFQSTQDKRAQVGPIRHVYRVLSDVEKQQVEAVKDQGQAFLDLIGEIEGIDGRSRELSIARTKIEEAVMWSVKHVTGPKAQAGEQG